MHAGKNALHAMLSCYSIGAPATTLQHMIYIIYFIVVEYRKCIHLHLRV